jgi:hypothetical protein
MPEVNIGFGQDLLPDDRSVQGQEGVRDKRAEH